MKTNEKTVIYNACYNYLNQHNENEFNFMIINLNYFYSEKLILNELKKSVRVFTGILIIIM